MISHSPRCPLSPGGPYSVSTEHGSWSGPHATWAEAAESHNYALRLGMRPIISADGIQVVSRECREHTLITHPDGDVTGTYFSVDCDRRER